MDREQFRKIFDQLDKDRIKEVILGPCFVALNIFPSLHFNPDSFISLCLYMCSAQHPPLPQYNSQVLQRLQEIFSHYYLTILGNAVALANVMCICVSCTHSLSHIMQTCSIHAEPTRSLANKGKLTN